MSNKIILIIRHAKAEEGYFGKRDFDRDLTKKGIKQAKFVGKLFRDRKIHPQKMLVSPATRTKNTAKIIAEKIAYPEENIIFEAGIYDASTSTLLDIIQKTDKETEMLCMVGHNPGVSNLADYLCGLDLEPLSTGSAVCISLTSDQWTGVTEKCGKLEWRLRPEVE